MNRTVHNAARTQEGGFVRLPFIWRKHLLGALTEENFACVVLRLVYDAVGRDNNLAEPIEEFVESFVRGWRKRGADEGEILKVENCVLDLPIPSRGIFGRELPANVRKSDAADANRLIWG